MIAAPQPVLVITHCSEHGTPFDLTRAAYHLGNRHVPIELKPDHLKIEPDHVLAAMLRSMHLIVREAEKPSSPKAAPTGRTAAAMGIRMARRRVGPVLHPDAYSGSHGHAHDIATTMTTATTIPRPLALDGTEHAGRPARQPACCS